MVSGVRGVLVSAIFVVAGLAACGGSGHAPAVVRVGDVAIGRSTVDHWTGIVERGGVPGDELAQESGTAHKRALDFLISAQWLIGEAMLEGAPVSDRAVGRALIERREVGGPREFEQELHATGASLADAKFDVRAELAAAAIRRGLMRRAADIGDTQIVSFYMHHLQPFRHREVRRVELIENLPSRRAAQALAGRIGTSPAFSKRAFHEEVAESTEQSSGTAKTALAKAIFAARPNVVSQPIPLNRAWAVFVVRKIFPATVKPLTEVRSEVVEKLIALRMAQFTAAFTQEYEKRWRAKTSCRPGFVVQRCAQSGGELTAGAEPFRHD